MVKRKTTGNYRYRASKKARTVSRALFAVPRNAISSGGELRTVLTFADYKPFIASAGSYTLNKYACNGLYDPDITGTGNQPHDFDQYAALYARYEVTKAFITVEFARAFDHADVTTATWPTIGAITCHNALGTVPTTTYEVSSLFNTNSAMIGVDGGVTKVMSTFEPKRILGFAQGDDVLAAGVTANPSQQAEWIVYVGNTGNSGQALIGARVVIKYHVRFFGRKQNTGS